MSEFSFREIDGALLVPLTCGDLRAILVLGDKKGSGMGLGWLMRMRLWVKNPPSLRQFLFFLSIVTIGIVIATIEHLGFWPDWATADRVRIMRP